MRLHSTREVLRWRDEHISTSTHASSPAREARHEYRQGAASEMHDDPMAKQPREGARHVRNHETRTAVDLDQRDVDEMPVKQQRRRNVKETRIPVVRARNRDDVISLRPKMVSQDLALCGHAP